MKSVRLSQKSLLPFLCNNIMTDFEKVIDFKNLYQAYKKAKSGKGFKNSSAKFEINALDGINILKEQLEHKQYRVDEYQEFYVYEPKKRLIAASTFKDKIVQHSLCDNVLLPTLKDVFIRNNFAGQKGKGTLFGLNTLKNEMSSFYQQYGGGFILKGDISKFFYSIDHQILKQIIRKYFSDENILWLCDLIIDSTQEKGLPLGNQTSQVFALLYLNDLDHYIVNDLKIEFYGRYMDDFYLIHKNKKYLKKCLCDIKSILNSLGLSLNEKTEIIPFRQGIKFLGFHTYVTATGNIECRLNNKNKNNALRKYRRMAKLVKTGSLSKEKFLECFQSWRSHALFGNCNELIENFQNEIDIILYS